MPESTPNPIVRYSLLTAVMQNAMTLDRVEINRIEFQPHQRSGVHLHPCPVLGLIVRGSIIFQIAGEPHRTLHAGEAFYEPANVTIEHFDAGDEPTTFVAFYLKASDDQELIRMLD